jgi:hypothetical protein
MRKYSNCVVGTFHKGPSIKTFPLSPNLHLRNHTHLKSPPPTRQAIFHSNHHNIKPHTHTHTNTDQKLTTMSSAANQAARANRLAALEGEAEFKEMFGMVEMEDENGDLDFYYPIELDMERDDEWLLGDISRGAEGTEDIQGAPGGEEEGWWCHVVVGLVVSALVAAYLAGAVRIQWA